MSVIATPEYRAHAAYQTACEAREARRLRKENETLRMQLALALALCWFVVQVPR